MEPYYTQAEHLYLVHGRHGEDPTEGPASADYAYPPVSHEPRIQQLSDDLEKLGLHPFHLPIGVNLQEVEPGRFNCVARWPGAGGGRSLMLNGHLDTNPAGEGWRHWGRNARKLTPGNLTVEMWPDMTEYGADEKYPAPCFTHAACSAARHPLWFSIASFILCLRRMGSARSTDFL